MNNILIVESENDKYFIESLITHINLDLKVDNPICAIDEYACINGISKLKNKLIELYSRVLKGDEINKIGIIFDADNVGIVQRTEEINLHIKKIFQETEEIEFKIFIMNINGFGELETVLKKIKSNVSPIADCLDIWQECLGTKKLKAKEFDKLWIQIYQRYDCCTNKEQKQAGRKCNNEVSFKDKSIYNLDKDIVELRELKQFLEEFRG